MWNAIIRDTIETNTTPIRSRYSNIPSKIILPLSRFVFKAGNDSGRN